MRTLLPPLLCQDVLSQCNVDVYQTTDTFKGCSADLKHDTAERSSQPETPPVGSNTVMAF